MSQRIEAVPAPAPPFDLRVTVTCDAAHGLFPPEPAAFIGADYAEIRNRIRAAGWRKNVQGWRGPCCSGACQESESD